MGGGGGGEASSGTLMFKNSRQKAKTKSLHSKGQSMNFALSFEVVKRLIDLM